jgi:hypothetical protein
MKVSDASVFGIVATGEGYELERGGCGLLHKWKCESRF